MRPFSLLAFYSIAMPFVPSAAYGHPLADQDGDVVTVTLPAASSVHGTLTIHRAQMTEYLKSEMGIDLEKLYSQRDHLADGPSGGNYTFPEGSGVEGVLSLAPTTTQQKAVSVPYQQHLTCDNCWGLCYIPILGPPL